MSCRDLILLMLVMAALPAQAQDLVIRNVTVVSPEREQPLRGVDVAIEDGRIAAISAQPLPSGDASIMDGTGRYLVPGLIDSHVHLRTIPGMRGDHEQRHPEIAADARQQIPKSYLFHGFTTLVDLNASADFVADWNAGEPAPQVLFCGAAPIANGYPMPFQPEAVRYRSSPNFLYDPRQADSIPPEYAPEDHSPAAVVGRIADAGAACVKLYYDSGYGGFLDWPNPTVEMARQVVAEAHARGMVVVLHSNAYDAHAFGLEAGIDVLAHGAWHWGKMNLQAGLPAPIEETLQQIAQRGIGYQATAQVLQGEMNLFDPAFLDDPRLADVLSAALLAWYRGDEAGWFRDSLAQDYGDPDLLARFVHDPKPGDHAALARAALGRLARVVGHLAAQDAMFLLGSDTPSSPSYSNVHGLNGRREIERLTEMGLSPRQIFEAATISNARAFGLDGEIGTVEPGKRADLLLLAEDPLQSTGAYDAIEHVIVAGEPIKREALSARAGE